MNNETLEKLLKSIEASSKKTIEDANKNQTNEIKDYINHEIAEIKTSFTKELDKRDKEYQVKYEDLKAKYDRLERELRKNKIIIFGLENTRLNLADHVINTLNQYLLLDLNLGQIDNIHTIGKQANKRPVVIKFVSYLTKQIILKNCKKLRGTSIIISDDLSLEERKEKKILRQHLTEARGKKLKAFIKGNRLIVNGTAYSVSELAELGEDIDVDYINNRGNNDLEITATIQKKSDSAPATPNINKPAEEEINPVEKEYELEEVFSIQKGGDEDNGIITRNPELPFSKTRASTRLLSLGDKAKGKDKTCISRVLK